jgi:quercetin dioxygenase-like cupin family protein
MRSRRGFIGCAICAATGLLATGAGAQAPTFTRTVVAKQDYPGSTHATLQVIVDVDPTYYIAPHTHPGIESAKVVSGSGVLSVKGTADRTVGPGDTYFIPPETPHALRNGTTKLRIAVTYVVEKDKPLATPAAL